MRVGDTIGRTLARVVASLMAPRPVLLCPWPARRRSRRLWELKCRAACSSAEEPVFYADEMDVHLNPKGRDWYECRWPPSAGLCPGYIARAM